MTWLWTLLKPVLSKVVEDVVKKFLENLAKNAGMPPGAQALSYDPSVIEASITDTVDDLSK